MVNFTISDGEDYWSKYEEFIEGYNACELSIVELREALGITAIKMKQYRERALEENRLNVIILHGKKRRAKKQ